jgi:hypothetical protein
LSLVGAFEPDSALEVNAQLSPKGQRALLVNVDLPLVVGAGISWECIAGEKPVKGIIQTKVPAVRRRVHDQPARGHEDTKDLRERRPQLPHVEMLHDVGEQDSLEGRCRERQPFRVSSQNAHTPANLERLVASKLPGEAERVGRVVNADRLRTLSGGMEH